MTRGSGIQGFARAALVAALAVSLAFGAVPAKAWAEGLDAVIPAAEEGALPEEAAQDDLSAISPDEADASASSDQPSDADAASVPEAATPGEGPAVEPAPEADGAPAQGDPQATEAPEVETDVQVPSAPEPSTPEPEAPDPQVDVAIDGGSLAQQPMLDQVAGEDGIIASGEWGTCTWLIDEYGCLEIMPTSGLTGVLDPSYYDPYSDWQYFPWKQYESYIKKVILSGHVSIEGSALGLFSGCANLEEADLGGLVTSSTTNLAYVFSGCVKLKTLDISSWDTSSVTDMRGTFWRCRSLTTLDLSSWDTSKVTNMYELFTDDASLESLNVSTWDTSSVTDMHELLKDCCSLTHLDVSAWNTSSVQSMANLFHHCTSLTSLDVSDWDTSSVRNMAYLFAECPSLTRLDLSRWDTSRVSNMSSMFYGCSSIDSLNLSSFDTRSLTDMNSMFSNCSKLATIITSGWDTSTVSDMTSTFSNCTKLDRLDLSGWDVSAVRYMSSMFCYCSYLESLDLTGWDTSSSPEMFQMFSGCKRIKYFAVDGFKPTDESYSFPIPQQSNGWWSSADQRWYTVSEILSSRSGVADVYTNGEIAVITPTAVELSETEFEYDGTRKRPAVSVRIGGDEGVLLRQGFDYRVSYVNNLKPGTATVLVTAMGGYYGKVRKYFTISPHTAVVRAVDARKAVGDPDPVLEVTVDGLLEGDSISYDVYRDEGEDLGTYAICPIGRHNQGFYSVTYEQGTFTIASSIGDATVDPIADREFTGSEICPLPTLRCQGKTLSLGTDYQLSYRDNVNAGTATVVISGIGAYAGTIERTFAITPKSVRVIADDVECGVGESVQLTATVEGLVGGETVSYELTREPGDGLGTYAITPVGEELQGNYCVTYVPGTLTIVKGSMANATVAGLGEQVYEGKACEPRPTVTLGGERLVAGTDYTVSYRNNSSVGTATVIIRGAGSYSGEKTATFRIAPASMSDVQVGKISSVVYTGRQHRPNPSLTYKGVKLAGGVDYTVSYASNVKAGTAKVTFVGKGNYTGMVSRTFKIAKAANPLAAKAKAKSVKVKLADVQAGAVKLASNVKVSKAKGKVSYANASSDKVAKKFKVSAKTGKVTVPKGTKKGTYKLRVKVTAKGNGSYKRRSRIVTYKVVVK